MPIQLVCTSCGKRLQVGDQYAGRKVACPGCKTVLTAPGTAAAPASPPPPAPKPAAAPAKAPAAAKPAAPPPPPPPAPAKKKNEELPFTFDSPRAKDEEPDEEESEPTPKKREAAKPPLSKRGRRDDDDDDDRPRKGSRARADEPGGATAKAWKSFGTGSGLARLGLWIEFLSLAYGIGMTAYVISGLIGDTVAMARTVNDTGGPTMFIPLFVGTAFGSLLTLLGRTRMIGIPPGTGAKKVFFGSWALTVIRFIAVLASAGLILKAGSDWPDLSKPGADTDAKLKDAVGYFLLAFVAFSVSTPFWILADLSTIPAMAIVGGEIPSARLRQKTGQVTFILQLLVLAYVLAVAAAAFGLSQVDWKGIGRDEPEVVTTSTKTTTTTTPAGRTTTTTTTKSSGAESAKSAIMVSAGLGILVQLAYTALFGSMYGAGRRAVAEAREEEERAEDEDV